MRPSPELGDWLTVLGLFAIGLLIDVVLAAIGLFILELLGLWPLDEASSAVPAARARAKAFPDW